MSNTIDPPLKRGETGFTSVAARASLAVRNDGNVYVNNVPVGGAPPTPPFVPELFATQSAGDQHATDGDAPFVVWGAILEAQSWAALHGGDASKIDISDNGLYLVTAFLELSSDPSGNWTNASVTILSPDSSVFPAGKSQLVGAASRYSATCSGILVVTGFAGTVRARANVDGQNFIVSNNCLVSILKLTDP